MWQPLAVIVFGRWILSGLTERDGVLPNAPRAAVRYFRHVRDVHYSGMVEARFPFSGGCRGIPPAIPAHLATDGFPRGKGECEGAWNEADEIRGRLFGPPFNFVVEI